MNSVKRSALIIHLIGLTMAVWFISCTNTNKITDEVLNNKENIIADLPINNISVELLESFPVQVHIVVEGILRDGCTTLNQTTQRREGNTIHLHVTTKRPKDAVCIQVISNIQERIPLEGGFMPGEYEVIVNGVEKAFKI